MRIELSEPAEKQLRKLKSNPDLYRRINLGLDEIAVNPNLGKPLSGDLAGMRACRIGDWRILYEVYLNQLRILVIRIAHRREAYR